MAITDAYATAAQYKAARRITDDTAPNTDAEILDDLKAVAHGILDAHLGRFFTVDVSDQKREIELDREMPDRSYLEIPDLSTNPTTVKIDSANDRTYATLLASSDFIMMPRNAALGPEPEPFMGIQLIPSGDFSNWFQGGVTVEIDGTWGWPAVPPAIRAANIELCAILRLQGQRATTTINESGEGVTLSNDAMRIIRDLQAKYVRRGW